MSASFKVHRCLGLEERSLFALSGEITEGMVHVGMRATLPGAESVFSAKVHGDEFLDSVQGDPAPSEPALTFSYSDPEKLRRWQAVAWPGKELRLGW
jgi:hypothetical protein